MRRRTDQEFAGDDLADWSDDRLERLLELSPGKLEPLGFARWPHDPAEVIGFPGGQLIRLQRDARAELDQRSSPTERTDR